VGSSDEGVDSLVRWLLSLRLPARRPLGPGTSVVIRDLVDELVDELVAIAGRATRKPVGMRTRLDMRGWKERTRVVVVYIRDDRTARK
jgi:hypothetical protein